MFKLAVVSDSHRNMTRVERFVKHANEKGYDAVVHCGDGASDGKWMERNLRMPFYIVAGNCDIMTWSDLPREILPVFEGIRFDVVHGDRYSVKYDETSLSYHAEEKGAKVALFGHSHRQFCAMVGNVLMVNPGTLQNGSYAEIDIDNGDIVPRLCQLP